ncbi:MAG: helix-turn-helix transcriptional regulator [Clostridia bacterium]|nr:helix-turn-helix transcriptional regulator [Clostridia bacterium]
MNELNETPQIGKAGLPMEAYRVTTQSAPLSSPLQSRTEHEILCVTQGELTLHINDATYSAGAGDMYFIQSGALLTVTDPTPDCVYEYIVFDLRRLVGNDEISTAYCEHLDDNTWRMNASLGRNPLGLRELFDNLFRIISSAKRIGYELEARGLVLQIIGRMLQDGRWHSSEQLHDHDAKAQRAVRRVLSLIEEHYAQELTLADMANAAELSPNYFCRYFKKIAGCSPVEYLIDYRINMAAYMLITTDESVADVALACGFNDASHFIKFFRRKKQVTPRRYRQLHAKRLGDK